MHMAQIMRRKFIEEQEERKIKIEITNVYQILKFLIMKMRKMDFQMILMIFEIRSRSHHSHVLVLNVFAAVVQATKRVNAPHRRI